MVWTLERQVRRLSSFVSNSLWPHELQRARFPCPSPTPRACSNSCPLIQWCYPTISTSVVPFSCCLQSFQALGSFPVSQFFASGGQSIGVSASASVLPMNNPLKSYTMDFKGRRLWCRFHHCSDFCVHVSLFVCMCLCVCALTLLGPQGHICRNTTLFQKNN